MRVCQAAFDIERTWCEYVYPLVLYCKEYLRPTIRNDTSVILYVNLICFNYETSGERAHCIALIDLQSQTENFKALQFPKLSIKKKVEQSPYQLVLIGLVC